MLRPGQRVVLSLHFIGNTRYDRKKATVVRSSEASGYYIVKSDVDGEELMVKGTELYRIKKEEE